MGKYQRKLSAEEELLHRQALSMALRQHQLSQRFEGSMSRRIGGSTSSRRRNLDDPLSNSKQVTTIALCLYTLNQYNMFLFVTFFFPII